MQLEEPVSVQDQVEQLFRDARDDIYYYVLTFGLSPAEAQEIAQDAFLRFYIALKEGNAIQSPRGWLFRAAHNLALNGVERRTTRRRFASTPAASGNSSENPEQLLLRKQSIDKIRAAMSTLSPQERLCLQLRADGLRYSEIAETTGVGLSTVSKFLSRAIAKLKKAIHE